MRSRFVPSPALVVACIALIVAMSGTAVAAVSFARNAGAVDGRSAVADGASLRAASGRLVATKRSGADRGRIDGKYLAGVMRGRSSTFGRALVLVDNQTLAPTPIGTVAGIGSVSATCADENAAAGRLDPATTLTFANSSGDAVNLARTINSNQATTVVIPLPNGTQHTFKISGSAPFTLHLQRGGTNYVVNGVVRQDGRNGPSAQCLVYGYTLEIPDSR